MKSKFKLFYNSYFTVQTIRPIASLVYKSKGPVIKQLSKVVISAKAVKNYFRVILIVTGLGYSQSGYRVIAVFIRRLMFLYKHSGIINTVKFFKTSSVMIQQSMAGHIEKDLTQIAGVRPSRSKSGLPALIPSVIRRRMLSNKGFAPISRCILSYFSIFRDIPFVKDTIKTSSITDPYIGSPSIIADLAKWIVPFVRAVWKLSDKHHFGVLTPRGWFLRGYLPKAFNNLDSEPFPIWKSSPQTGSIDRLFPTFSTHPRALHASAWALDKFKMTENFTRFAVLINAKSVLNLFQSALKVPILEQDRPLLARIGKLGMVKEAAGKVRVFAMVDAWTQWLLYPIHKDIFSLLKRIPMDGTFNQTRPLKKVLNWPCQYSYDLSSATDRLPIRLQTLIISKLYNNIELSQLWERLLVGRGYSTPAGKSLHYSVGQPMGALSSWAMLAFTHHFIVQCAAWRSGKIPVGILFRKYAVLGDDIVIGDKLVAKHYFKIINQLGVKVGLAKSVLSPKGQGFEFAKKTFCRGENISAIPFKEYAVTSGSLPALIEFSRKYDMSIPSIVKMLGYGYKVLGSLNRKWVFQSVKIRRLLIGLTIPIDDASFNNWVSQFPKTVSSDTMFAFRAIIEKELSRISTWMSKSSQFLSHDLSSWQKEYCLFVTAFSSKKVTINSSTLPIPDEMRRNILDDPLAKRRTKFY